MAERQEVGQYYTFEVGDGASPEVFTPAACLTDVEPNVATKVIDGTSFCGPAYRPGFSNSTIAIKGFMDYGGSSKTGNDLFTLQQNGTLFDFKIVPVTPVTGDISYAGNGFLSGWKVVYQVDVIVGFDVSIQVNGNLTQTKTP